MSRSRSKRKQRETAAFPKNKVPTNNEIYTHERSIDFMGLQEWLPNPDVILEQLGQRDQTAYDNILTDSHLSGVMMQRKSGVTSLLWDVERGKAKSTQAKFVKEMIENLNVYGIIENALNAPYFGMVPMEIVWENQNGRIVAVQVIGKPPEWFQFDNDNQIRFISNTSISIGEVVPPRKIILVRHNPTYKQPYGEALLSKVFWPITFKKGIWKFWIASIEKFGSPIVWGQIPRGNDDNEYKKLADTLADMIQDNVIITPLDSEIELIEPKGSGVSPHELAANFCNSETSKVILGETLTTEATDKGTQALGTVHENVGDKIILKDKRMIEDMFNTLIRWALELNFGNSDNPPQFCLFSEEGIHKDLAERDKLLADTGQVQFTQGYIERAYNFDKGDVIVKEPSAEEPAKKEEEFQEGEEKSEFADQKAVDNFVDGLTDKDLQKSRSDCGPHY